MNNVVNELLSRIAKLERECERLDSIIDELLRFIEGMFDEEAITHSFDMTTKEFIVYIKSKIKEVNKE